jgi:hypothetical protein
MPQDYSHFKNDLVRLINKAINIRVGDGGVKITNFIIDNFSYYSDYSATTEFYDTIYYDMITSVTDSYFTFKHFKHKKENWDYAICEFTTTVSLDRIISMEYCIGKNPQEIINEFESKIKRHYEWQNECEKRERINLHNKEIEEKEKKRKSNFNIFISIFLIIFSIGWVILCYLIGAPIWIPFFIALIWSYSQVYI